MVRVINAELKDDYKIYIEFNDGIKGTVDFKKILEEDHRAIIRELLNKDLFKTVKVSLHTLCWDNEVDFAPEYLHDQIETGKKAA
jgi:Mg/Co/Ni transporter MgtE